MKDQNGTPLEVGDTVSCTGLEFEIESFQKTPTGYLACGDYGCFAVNLLVKVEK